MATLIKWSKHKHLEIVNDKTMDVLNNLLAPKIKKSHKVIAFISLIIGVLISTFVYSIQNGMHQTVTSGFHSTTMAIAISHLKYGLTGYRGYQKVYKTLKDNGMPGAPQSLLDKYKMTAREILTNADILNNAIKMAIDVDDVSREGQFSLEREDLGMVTYQELSFRIFGYKVESFLYLYFLLLSFSIFIFLITYYKRIDLLNILLIFVCSHYVIVAVAPLVGDLRLQTVHNDRFLPVLGVLPTLYLAQLGLGKTKLTLVKVISASIQALIIMLVIHVRTGALWQIMFLIVTFGLTILWCWFRRPEAGKYVLNKNNLWVPAVVILCLMLFKMHMLLSLHFSYNNVTSKHLFWHPMYEGLGAHPDGMSKYAISWSDYSSYQIVRKRTQEQYGTDDWYSLGGYRLFESILKDEYAKILIDDPRFFVENYLYKFLLFFENYFSRSFGVVYYFFNLPILLIIMVGSILAGEVFLKRSLSYFIIMIIGIAFSLLPAMVGMPFPHLIADPTMMVTAIIYMIISMGACYIIQQHIIKKWDNVIK